mmetsp:Transcript_135343/g.350706  ORF Transcript_135343/g.350706 Transcript_135343/m.350706 type:complete len:251 (-) Transcript_135343:41-793(-)
MLQHSKSRNLEGTKDWAVLQDNHVPEWRGVYAQRCPSADRWHCGPRIPHAARSWRSAHRLCSLVNADRKLLDIDGFGIAGLLSFERLRVLIRQHHASSNAWADFDVGSVCIELNRHLLCLGHNDGRGRQGGDCSDSWPWHCQQPSAYGGPQCQRQFGRDWQPCARALHNLPGAILHHIFLCCNCLHRGYQDGCGSCSTRSNWSNDHGRCGVARHAAADKPSADRRTQTPSVLRWQLQLLLLVRWNRIRWH